MTSIASLTTSDAVTFGSNNFTTSTDFTTFPLVLPCTYNETTDPWCGVYDARRIGELILLVTLSVIGTFGNLLVISSITCTNSLGKNGNIFVVNLACADLLVSSVIIPLGFASVYKTYQAVPDELCQIIGYLTVTATITSLGNLMMVAVNRYVCVLHRNSYDKHFSKSKSVLMAIMTWVWGVLCTLPTRLGWSSLRFDVKMGYCTFDDTNNRAYSLTLILVCLGIPLVITTACYIRIFSEVRKTAGKFPTKASALERQLLIMFSAALLMFALSWLPYGCSVIFDSTYVDPYLKKFAGHLALSNSCMNFIIYGLLNERYRGGYFTFLQLVFCCKRSNNRATDV